MKNPYLERDFDVVDGELYFDSRGKRSDARYRRRLFRYDKKVERQREREINTKINAQKRAKLKTDLKNAYHSYGHKNTFKLVSKLFGLSILTAFLFFTFSGSIDAFFDIYKTTIRNDSLPSGEIEFYNYDWRFKMNQLSNLKPVLSKESLFVDNDMHSITEMSPYEFQNELTLLVKNGSIKGTPNTSLWYVPEDAINFSYANYILNYYYFTNNLNEYFGGTNASSQFFYYDSNLNDDIIGDVVPREKEFNRWVKQYNSGRFDGDNYTPFLDSTLVFLTIPQKLIYDLYVIGDFILRW